MKPIVKVIAYSNFLGVPNDLLPDTKTENLVCGTFDKNGSIHKSVVQHNQDRGSMLERLIECAGRTCYDSYGKGRSSEEYHKHILEVGHGSVLEHATLSFFISGISRGCSHELVRHRAGVAISQRSTRFVDETKSEWVTHPMLEKTLKETGDHDTNFFIGPDSEEVIDDSRSLYEDVVNYLMLRGVDRKTARGAARGFLGNALSTELIWTCNIRALRSIIEQRCTDAADAEIRLLFNEIYDAAKTYCPAYLSDYEQTPAKDGIGYCLSTIHRKI